MKAIFTLITLLLFAVGLNAQTFTENATKNVNGNGKTHLFAFTVAAAVDTATSSDFSLEDGKYETIYQLVRYNLSATGKPKVTLTREVSWFNSVWSTDKTWATSDSLETVRAEADTLKVGAKYRYVWKTTTGNATDTAYKLRAEFVRKN